MPIPNCQIRRATLDDVPQLRKLWADYQFSAHDLEKRFTEFKVAVSQTGEVFGGLGMQIFGHHAHLHSEAFYHPELEDELRQAIWERIQVVAHTRGINRFWTQETAPFWKHYAGFREVENSDRSLLPQVLGDPHAQWMTLILREETEQAAAREKQLLMDQQLEWYKMRQQEGVKRAMFQAKLVRNVITFMAFLLFVAVVVAGLYMTRRQQLLIGR